MYCDECGKEIADNSQFCGYCGATVQGAVTQAGPPPAPPGPPAAPPPQAVAGAAPAGPPPGPPMQAGPYAPPPRKKALPWVLGGIGLAAVIAIVLVLVFVVFGGDDTPTTKGDNGGLTGPEQVVQRFFSALEDEDAEMLLNTFEPSFRKEFKKALGDDYEAALEEYFFAALPDDLKVEIRGMETEIDGDTAVVTIVDGTMSYTDEYGDKVTEEASEGEVDPVLLVKVSGKWYLSGEAAKEAGFDPDLLKDIDGSGTKDGDGSKGDGGADEIADVEAAMLAYAEENSAEGLEFEIYNLFIKGDEAVAVAVCTNQELEVPYIIMEKGSSGWYGVEFGTGGEIPAWYENEMAELEADMIAYVEANTEGGLEFEIYGLFTKGDQACGAAVCTNQELDAPWVVMEKGPSGWSGVAIRSGDDPPSWYPEL